MSERMQYRYRGTDRRGNGHYGQHWHEPGELAAQVERWFTQGWRATGRLLRCRSRAPGAGEVPVAFIGPDPGTGKRTWWAGERQAGEPHD